MERQKVSGGVFLLGSQKRYEVNMAVQRSRKKFEGSAVDLKFEVATQGTYLAAIAKFNAVPTTAEDFTIKLVNEDDSDYSVVLERDDPSADGGLTDLVFRYRPFPIPNKAHILAEYPNSDGNTVAVVIIGADSIMMP